MNITAEGEIRTYKDPNSQSGSTRVEMMFGDECASWLEIVPLTIRIGASVVRMDGIANVSTGEAHRMKGYSRKVLEAAIEHMTAGDAAITMLYGIPDFYHKFDYATVGPDHIVALTNLNRDDSLPSGWHVRPFHTSDLPAVRGIYYRCTAGATGPVVRAAECERWSQILSTADAAGKDACRVVVDASGQVHGYAWLAYRNWYMCTDLPRKFPQGFLVGESLADGPESADALLAACRVWAREEAKKRVVTEIILPIPPEGPLAYAAMDQDARFTSLYSACAGSMARVLNVERLLRSLLPEIEIQLRSAHSTYERTIVLRTDFGDAALIITRDQIQMMDPEGCEEETIVRMPQTTLSRLALGAFPASDLLSRLPEPPDRKVEELIGTMFPKRHSHMYMTDRY